MSTACGSGQGALAGGGGVACVGFTLGMGQGRGAFVPGANLAPPATAKGSTKHPAPWGAAATARRVSAWLASSCTPQGGMGAAWCNAQALRPEQPPPLGWGLGQAPSIRSRDPHCCRPLATRGDHGSRQHHTVCAQGWTAPAARPSDVKLHHRPSVVAPSPPLAGARVSRHCHHQEPSCWPSNTSVPRPSPCPTAWPRPPALGPPGPGQLDHRHRRAAGGREAPALLAAPTPRSSRRSQEGSS